MVQELDLEGKVVLVRVDFNVPVDEKGEITDYTRIKKALEAGKAYENAKQIIFMSHFGKPKEDLKKGMDFDEVKKKNTLKPVADYLASSPEIKDFAFVDDCLGEIPNHRYILLENLRLRPEEESKIESDEDKTRKEEFVRKLSHNADAYVNDAFGACHRKHASIVDVPKYFKSIGKPVAKGLLLQTEIDNLDKLLPKEDEKSHKLIMPPKPFVAVLGGKKVSDKIGAIYGLMDFADSILIGGGMAYTFLKYKGHKIGNSLFEEKIGEKDYKQALDEIYLKAEEKNINILLPIDHVVADKIDKDGKFDYNASIDIADELIGVDIGKETMQKFLKAIEGAKTIFWNGPMGVFELIPSGFGTKKIARAIAENKKAFRVLGGGDTIAAVNKFGIKEDEYSFISTGGGASLEYIELKGELPGIVALR